MVWTSDYIIRCEDTNSNIYFYLWNGTLHESAKLMTEEDTLYTYCFEKWNGLNTFAIYDKETRKLTIISKYQDKSKLMEKMIELICSIIEERGFEVKSIERDNSTY
jgi:hypothetical protein